jgi:mono/diheme cytochrome c family protein
MAPIPKTIAGTLLLWLALSAAAQPGSRPASRGELLYANHCVECHSTQMHWRDQRLARDWDSLKAQVRNWQGKAGLGWSEADVDEVASYLNGTIYGFERRTQTSRR